MKRNEFVELAGKAWDLMETNPEFLGSVELNVWRYNPGNRHDGRVGWMYNLVEHEGIRNENPEKLEDDFYKLSRTEARHRRWWRWDCK